ncbi:MAG: fluoride efflux transporter CrcB [Puniceicoccaceae bacterium]|nr:MAG: fluoride efflux transporter CrcB [Puniceicoccaceae bacterium]
MLFLLVFIACALGGIGRYLGTAWITRILGARFPWGTLGVNVLGSFLLGLFLGIGWLPGADSAEQQALYSLGVIGFCGGLTTFSTFSLQSFSLVTEQAWGRALANLLGTVLLCLLAVLGGYAMFDGGSGV